MKSHKPAIDTDCIVATKCYHWPVHLQDNNRHGLETTRSRSRNLWIPDWVINNWFSRGHHQEQLTRLQAMTQGSRGQLHVPYWLVSKYYQVTFRYIQSIHFAQNIYIIQSPRKYFPNTFTISSHDGMVQEGCDCTVSYTQEQACHLSHCRWLL